MATGQITILDITDLPSLQGYLSATQPKHQFLNTAGTSYNPSWIEAPNLIFAELYRLGGGTNIIAASEVKSIKWYKDGVELIASDESIVLNPVGSGNGLNTSITIGTDSLMNATTPGMRITCEIQYSPGPAYDATPITIKLDIDFFLSVQGNEGGVGPAGSDSYTVGLTNETHTISCDQNGIPNTGELGLAGSTSSNIIVFKGASQLIPVAETVTPVSGEYNYVLGEPVNCTVVRNDDESFYISEVTADSGSITVMVSLEGDTLIVPKIFTWTKSKMGVDGAPAQVIDITGSQVFTYNTAGILIGPGAITMTAAKKNIDGVVTWKYDGNGADPVTIVENVPGETVISGDTLQVYPAATIWSTFKSLTFEASIDTVKDTFTMYKVQDGAAGEATVVYDINSTQYVIAKDAPDAATSGIHTNVVVTGKKYIGTSGTTYGYLTVTANGDTETETATANSIVTAIADDSGKTSYTVRLYDSANKTTLLDTLVIPVVFKGLSGGDGEPGVAGLDALTPVLTNEAHTLPVDEDEVVTYTGSGTDIYVYEGSTALQYDGSGSAPGTFTITPAVTSGALTTIGEITDSGSCATVAQHNLMETDLAVVTYTITGKRTNGTTFTLVKSQTLSKVKAGVSIVPSLYATSEVFKNAPSSAEITLTMDLYKAGIAITSGVTYAWYKQPSENVLGTGKTLVIRPADVDSLEVFRCVTTYNSKTYTDYITIIDITDPYQIELLSTNGNIFKNGLGSTTLKAVVRRNGTIEDASGALLLYIWRKVDKDGNNDGVANKGAQIPDIAIDQTMPGLTATLTGSSTMFTAGKYFVFGEEKVARRVFSIVGTTVTFTEATTVAIGTGVPVYAITNTNSVDITAADVYEKASFFVDVDTP
jgi:hypothetical protein